MKYEKFIHIENINDFSKKEELYKMHEIIKKILYPIDNMLNATYCNYTWREAY